MWSEEEAVEEETCEKAVKEETQEEVSKGEEEVEMTETDGRPHPVKCTQCQSTNIVKYVGQMRCEDCHRLYVVDEFAGMPGATATHIETHDDKGNSLHSPTANEVTGKQYQPPTKDESDD